MPMGWDPSTKDGSAHQVIIYGTKNKNLEGLCPAYSYMNGGGEGSIYKFYLSHTRKSGYFQWVIS